MHPITNQRWDNNYPHNQEIENIPPYFKKCLIEFKQYHSKFGNSINEKIDSKKIYNNLMNEKNHRPASIIRYPEMGDYLAKLTSYKFLDPYLRDFLFRLYHCKLNFKRYRLNLDDLLNFGQRCILCQDAIDTPSHLFETCEKGRLLREKRDILINALNHQNMMLGEDQKVYSFFNNTNVTNKALQYIICASNYSIYKVKLKKFFNSEYLLSDEEAMFCFINRVKLRILCDFRRLEFQKFTEVWDAQNSQNLFRYNNRNIINWFF